MTNQLKKSVYTAEATVVGGREGHGRTADGTLELDLRLPKEMGGAGGGANPEQLFALGYAACFQSALAVVGRRSSVDTSESTVTARVTLGTIDGGAYGLAVELDVQIPGISLDMADRLTHLADHVCPYSNAIRGNVDVKLTTVAPTGIGLAS